MHCLALRQESTWARVTSLADPLSLRGAFCRGIHQTSSFALPLRRSTEQKQCEIMSLLSEGLWPRIVAEFRPETVQEGAESQTRRASSQPTIQTRQPCCATINLWLVIRHAEPAWPQPAALLFFIPTPALCSTDSSSARLFRGIRSTGVLVWFISWKVLESEGIRLWALVHWCFNLLW